MKSTVNDLDKMFAMNKLLTNTLNNKNFNVLFIQESS